MVEMEQSAEIAKEKKASSKNIQKDSIDYGINHENSGYAIYDSLKLAFPAGFAAFAGGFLSEPALSGTGILLVSSIGGNFLASVAKIGIDYAREKRSNEVNVISDDEFKYRAERFVYKGQGIRVRDVNLKKGDNFIYLKMPFAVKRTLDPRQEKLIGAFYRCALKDVRSRLAKTDLDYRAIGIDLPWYPGESGTLSNAPNIQMKKFFEERGSFKADETHHPIILLSKDTFEKMSLEPNQVFNGIVDALELQIGNKIAGKEVINRLRNLENFSYEGKIEEARVLRKQVDHLFSSFAEGIFNGLPDVTIERTENHSPIRKRNEIHPTLKITKTNNGVFLEQISYMRGDKRLLAKLDMPLEEVAASNSTFKPLLITYSLSQLLKDPKILDEMTTPDPDQEIILEEMEKLGIELDSRNEMSIGRYTAPKRLSRIKNVVIASTLGTAALGAMAAGAIEVTPNIIHINNPNSNTLGKKEAGAQMSLVRDSEKPAFEESIPESHMDWKIEAIGNANPEGYYIVSTSNKFVDGKWLINSGQWEDIKFLSGPYENPVVHEDKLKLEGLINLDVLGKAQFKLPLKEGTALAKFNLYDVQGNPIDPNSYQLIYLKDGTYQVNVDVGPFAQKAFVKVSEELVEMPKTTGTMGETAAVHATTRIPAINLNKLSPEAFDILKIAGGDLQKLQDIVSDKRYSIHPADADKLLNQDGSPESFVNAAASVSASDCDISNGEYALLSSVIASPTYLNVARGYIVGIQNGAVNGSFLDAAAAHEFTIDHSGKVWDATASNGILDKDNMTRMYLEQLDSKGPSKDFNQVWQDQLSASAESEKQQNIIMMLFEITGAGVVTAGSVMTLDGLRRRFTKEKISSKQKALAFKRTMFRMSKKQLEEAYNFFNWLSYGGESDYQSASRQNLVEDQIQAVNTIRRSVLFNKLQEYVSDPLKFEQKAGIKDVNGIRRLAKYVIS